MFKNLFRCCQLGLVLAVMAFSSPVLAQAKRSLGLAISVAGKDGERKTRGEINGHTWLLARIDSRLQNRVQSRLRSRIEQDDRTDDTLLSSYGDASRQIRRRASPR